MATLKSARVEVYDRYGHYGEAGKVVEETLELRHEDGAFTVVQIDARGREGVQVPPTTYEDAREAFDMIAAARVPEFLR